MLRCLCILLAFLLLVGCAGKPVVGVVKGKKFIPAHTDTEMILVGEQVMLWTTWVPDGYRLHVLDAEGDMHTVKVSKTEYEAAKDGDHYPPEGQHE